MHTSLDDITFREQLIFLGETLGPFFLQDPIKGNAGQAFKAMSLVDPHEAGIEWPFVEDILATQYLTLMHDGLQEGIDTEDLIWEYRRLFIGPEQKPAPPWGSVYTDHECVVFGASTLALRQWMREKGIGRIADTETPEDHIGLMIVLLAWLAENKPEVVEEYLSDHLLTWSSHFLNQLTKAARHPFYKGLALLTKASLEGIQATLRLEVTYPRYYR